MSVWNSGPRARSMAANVRGRRHAHYEDRGPALQRRLARLLVSEDQHRRRCRRLVGVHGFYGSDGLSGVIRKLGARLIGWDPRPVEKITAYLHGVTRQSVGGIAHQAIAAIENALVDLKAKALGMPVYEMLGGPVRDRLQLYWSHCGTWRISHASPDQGMDRVRPDPLAGGRGRAGAEVARRGFKGLKTNIMRFDAAEPYIHMPGFNGSGWPELNIDRSIVDALVAQMTAFRNGVRGRASGCIST